MDKLINILSTESPLTMREAVEKLEHIGYSVEESSSILIDSVSQGTVKIDSKSYILTVV